MALEKGKEFSMHCYKHNGQLHKVWDNAIYLGEENNFLIFANHKTLVTEEDGKRWKTKEPAIIFFPKNKWYNIIGQIKKKGITYYCNITSPYIIEEDTIKFIDYDLDVRVFMTGAFKVLDRGEYNHNKKKMKYAEELNDIIKKSLTELIELIREKKFPFNNSIVEKYYNSFESLNI